LNHHYINVQFIWERTVFDSLNSGSEGGVFRLPPQARVSALSLGSAPVTRYAVGLKSIWNILESFQLLLPAAASRSMTEMSN
jgi:hypothetical protein